MKFRSNYLIVWWAKMGQGWPLVLFFVGTFLLLAAVILDHLWK